MKFLFIFLSFFLTEVVIAQTNIIPIPVQHVELEGEFVFENQISIECNADTTKILTVKQFLQDFLLEKHIKVVKKNSKIIFLNINKKTNTKIGDEGYQLKVKKNKIIISANTSAGLFYGVQTLKQLFPVKKDTDSYHISYCEITDYPRFEWRGLMLDVSRHFFNVDDIKSYLDKMAMYKFNTFHWHLTDDHGWRIEIKSLPLLTEVGAWRVKRNGFFGVPEPKPNEKATDGGYYTHKDIKEIVKYAQDRNITIVPEIDMPGHSMAALAAYPNLSTKKEPKFVNPGTKFAEWYGNGKFKMLIENMLNPIDEEVYVFADKVFTEVAQLFPGKYIHMGGDECYHGYWEESKDVNQFMKEHNIKDTHELQAYFVNRIEKIIQSKGKKMIGWDEISEGKVSPETAIMNWREVKYGIAASKEKHPVVMSPMAYAYLDYTQGDYSVENKVYADLSLEKTYLFDPLPKEADANYILGGQGNLWSENVATIDFAFYMTYPRAFALAESLWSPIKLKDWKSFINRTQNHFLRFDKSNTNISKAVYDPIIKVYKSNDSLMCQLTNSIPNSVIYYTIDNTYPPLFGTKYTKPFSIPYGNLKLCTQTYINNKAIGRELLIDRKELEKRVKK